MFGCYTCEMFIYCIRNYIFYKSNGIIRFGIVGKCVFALKGLQISVKILGLGVFCIILSRCNPGGISLITMICIFIIYLRKDGIV